jgi:hypothetical protein
MLSRINRIVAMLALAAAAPAWAQCVPAWGPLDRGIEKAADALLVFDDGTGQSLYVGGEFDWASGLSARRVARWDGQQWHALGAGFQGATPRATVLALAEFDDGTGPALYAGGTFNASGGTTVNAIARWDGALWHPLGEGFGIVSPFSTIPVVSSIVVYDDGHGEALYAAGFFNRTGGKTLSHIARWNGTSWVDVGGGVWPGVLDMVVHDDGTGDAIYVAGGIWNAGSMRVLNIARWDGKDWTPVGDGLGSAAWALAVVDDGTREFLYAAQRPNQSSGYFSLVSMWDGQHWTQVGEVMAGTIRSMTAFDDGSGPALIAGTTVGLNGGLMKWDGAQWIPYLGGAHGSRFADVSSLIQGSLGTERSLFVSGSFASVGPGVSAFYIARWNTCVPNCYADCDQSTGSGVLDILDFLCFQSQFVLGFSYACDCDASTGPGVCDVFDFLCFQNAFVAGCP